MLDYQKPYSVSQKTAFRGGLQLQGILLDIYQQTSLKEVDITQLQRQEVVPTSTL